MALSGYAINAIIPMNGVSGVNAVRETAGAAGLFPQASVSGQTNPAQGSCTRTRRYVAGKKPGTRSMRN
jgi:hypothetical protein